MAEAGIGRVLVASLHQAIADILPTRLEFYENWLSPDGLRNGTIGLAPLAAVLSFLRLEGDAYGLVTTRAGEYAADWTMAALPDVGRAIARRLPTWARARVALQLSRRMVHDSYIGSRAIVRVRRGVANVDIRASIFCGVRERSAEPRCGLYAAAIGRFLHLLGATGEVEVRRCRATGDSGCILTVALRPRPGAGAGEAP